jgi:hypothetical protein
MGSSSRQLLNQSTHSSVANSTASHERHVLPYHRTGERPVSTKTHNGPPSSPTLFKDHKLHVLAGLSLLKRPAIQAIAAGAASRPTNA